MPGSGQDAQDPPLGSSTGTAPVLELRGITKRFGALVANDRIDLDLRAGEVHALLGENGAGKSTLMNVLYGLLRPDEGEILVDGRPAELRSSHDALALGIGMVHQHFMLIPVMSVVENIVLGDEPRQGLRLDLASAAVRVRELSSRYGLAVDPGALVGDLGVGQQQRVEILKALYRDARILVLDEPTSVLTPQEVDDLFRVLGELVAGGTSIILITHKLHEVLAVADRISVLRRGRKIATIDRAEADERRLAELMVGREVLMTVDRAPATPGDVVLHVEDLAVADERGLLAVRGVSFAGVGHIPEDRHRHGLVLGFSLAENAALHGYFRPPTSSHGLLDADAMRAEATRLIERYDVRGGDAATPAGSLSGGNQQKLVLAREIEGGARLLLAAQPTRGLDVGAIEFVHRQLVAQRDAGCAILLVSFELDEILDLADRILVLFHGEVALERRSGETTEQELGFAMIGGRDAAEAVG